MREILYRAKRADNGEWIFGDLVHSVYKINDTCVGKYGCTLGMYQVILETVGQYTGLTDKNGKKIFEGDIVRFGKNIYQIVSQYGSFCLYDNCRKMISKIGGLNDRYYALFDLYFRCCWDEDWAYDIEVISNIHDTPDLLEVYNAQF